MSKRVAIFGGSFNPFGEHHRRVVGLLAKLFDRVIVFPCGPRPDKATTNDIMPLHRAAMIEIALRHLSNVEVDLTDVEHGTFTRNHDYDAKFGQRGEVWQVVGADLVVPDASGRSEIQRVWLYGDTVWQHGRFIVLTRPGYRLDPAHLPPQSQVVEIDVAGASSDVRRRIFDHQPVTGLVAVEVENYIETHQLYQQKPHRISAPFQFTIPPRCEVVVDPMNPKAIDIATAVTAELVVSSADQECIVVVGGDGFFLHTVGRYHQRRLPFFGINAGHVGWLLNNLPFTAETLQQPLVRRTSPLLYVAVTDLNGSVRTGLAFNDAWMERTTTQTGWWKLTVNGQVRYERMMGDAILVASAAGSTGYARFMGAQPVELGTYQLVLAGSCIMQPERWQAAHLDVDTVIEIEPSDLVKRPMRAVIDGADWGVARRMLVRSSRTAAADILFRPDSDIRQKLEGLQFRS